MGHPKFPPEYAYELLAWRKRKKIRVPDCSQCPAKVEVVGEMYPHIQRVNTFSLKQAPCNGNSRPPQTLQRSIENCCVPLPRLERYSLRGAGHGVRPTPGPSTQECAVSQSTHPL